MDRLDGNYAPAFVSIILFQILNVSSSLPLGPLNWQMESFLSQNFKSVT